MPNILALIESPDHVCYRYRVQAFISWWRERGWHVQPLPIARGGAGFLRQLPRIQQADVVVLQRRLLPIWKLLLLRRASKVLIFDLDDAVFLRDNNSTKSAHSHSRWSRFRWTARCSDAVLAGNQFLADRADSTGTSGTVYVIPTCLDVDRYSMARHERADRDIKLVWIGSRSTMSSLDDAAAGLRAANRILPGLETRVICDAVPHLDGVKTVGCPWSHETECQDIADSDVGISYLPDHPWSKGKCGLKVLQYMAAGLPVVANPVGVHVEMIEHGKTGFLCRSPHEWASAIQKLAASPELRAYLALKPERLSTLDSLRSATPESCSTSSATCSIELDSH